MTDAQLIAALLDALQQMHKHFITESMYNIGEEEERIERLSIAAISAATGDDSY